ncbi:SDR family NAD(P)-dependent oxidoreductase [Actinophytocola sp.]|uniref:SDR family NAD(P)-dependent oxidoreductase n=1 Tax=Actinophytocola sp. TaxID=1872138 RepID=UPI003D6A2A65
MDQLDGRVAVVTGAGGGIGAAVAKRLAAEGAAVVVNDLGTSVIGSGEGHGPADTVVDDIRASGGRAVADYADVGDFEAAESLIKHAIGEFGRFDVLINVAGILRDRMVFNMSAEEWDSVIRVHLRGTFNTTRHASAYWRSNRGGSYRLINFASRAGLFGGPGQPNYAAAKAGIIGFTYSCANALARYGVTSNIICPTAATRMIGEAAGTLVDQLGLRDPDEMAPDNVTPAVLYLASERSAWLNGRVVGASGRRITLYTNPEVEREIVSVQPWTLESAFDEIERVFQPAVEHRGMFDSLTN